MMRRSTKRRITDPKIEADPLTNDRHSLDELAAQTADRQAQAAKELLSRDFHPLPVLRMVANAAANASRLIDSSPDRERRECRAGCSACCHLAVSLTAAEAMWIAAQLREELNPEALEAIRARVSETSKRVSQLTIEERARARVPCALLGADGACTVYEIRPIGCRAWTSFSRTDCESALREQRPGHDGPVDRVAWIAGGSTTEGLERAFRELGLDGRQYEFHSALLRALEQADALARWFAGEHVFEGCTRVRSQLLP